MSKILVLFSGGADSTTALAMAIDRYGLDNVITLTIIYGQRNIKEVEASNKIAEYYGVKHITMDVSQVFQYSNSSLLAESSEEVSKETLEEQLEKTKKKPIATYVPFRNGLLLSVASVVALSNGCGKIYYGVQCAYSEQAVTSYPDCGYDFNDAMADAIYYGTGKQLRLATPLIDIAKKDIVKIGLVLGVPYELTWSCYENGNEPCRKCCTCIDRHRAFLANGIDLY